MCIWKNARQKALIQEHHSFLRAMNRVFRINYLLRINPKKGSYISKVNIDLSSRKILDERYNRRCIFHSLGGPTTLV